MSRSGDPELPGIGDDLVGENPRLPIQSNGVHPADLSDSLLTEEVYPVAEIWAGRKPQPGRLIGHSRKVERQRAAGRRTTTVFRVPLGDSTKELLGPRIVYRV